MKASPYDKVWERVAARLEVVGSVGLSDDDKDLIREALVMRLYLLHDLTAGSPTGKIPECWRRTIMGLRALDVESYSSDWSTLREIVTSRELREVYPDPAACQRVFKLRAAGLIHYKWILSTTCMLVEGDDWWARVNQWIVFDTKLNLRSLDLTTQACSDYLDFERSIPFRGRWRSPDGKGERVLNVTHRAASDLFGDFDIRQYKFRPSHGNGATAEVKRSESDWWHKNRHFAVDGDIIRYMRWRVPQDDWHDWFYVPYRGLDRCAELVCVPKSMSKNRTISKEPTTLQYLQQDVFRAFDDYFLERLPHCVDLHDQSKSRELAQQGSTDGSYATIDLSNASDSVTLDLVEEIFNGLPMVYPLIATRSTHVHVASRDGEIDERIETKKFAPMGSAVCFPVETAVYVVIAETAVRLVSGRASHIGDYRVYGDDTVIRGKFAATYVELLQFYGFDVNVDKSFYDDADATTGVPLFREACGIECLGGINVTPLRLSRRLVSLHTNDSGRKAGEGVGMIDLVNRCYLYRYAALRKWIVSVLDRYVWFRTCQYLAYGDYCDFCNSLQRGQTPWVRVATPFIITDDGSDTNYRAFRARHMMADTPIVASFVPIDGKRSNVPAVLQSPEAEVTTVVPVRAKRPVTACKPTITTRRKRTKRKSKARKGKAPVNTVYRSDRVTALGDDNDYFTWNCRRVARNNAEPLYELDAMGIATIRPSGLQWSKKWVALRRVAHLRTG